MITQRGAFVSEPAILVRRLTGSQVWTMEKLENKLIDMRELYQEYKDRPLGMMVNIRNDFLYVLLLIQKKRVMN